MKLFINLVLSAILVVFSFRASEGQMDAAIRARVAGYTLVMAHVLQKKLASFWMLLEHSASLSSSKESRPRKRESRLIPIVF